MTIDSVDTVQAPVANGSDFEARRSSFIAQLELARSLYQRLERDTPVIADALVHVAFSPREGQGLGDPEATTACDLVLRDTDRGAFVSNNRQLENFVQAVLDGNAGANPAGVQAKFERLSYLAEFTSNEQARSELILLIEKRLHFLEDAQRENLAAIVALKDEAERDSRDVSQGTMDPLISKGREVRASIAELNEAMDAIKALGQTPAATDELARAAA